MPLNIGLSGLNAAAADLRITGNNIANVGTTGFKESRAEFGDLFAQSYNANPQTSIGSGVRLLTSAQQFNQGSIEMTQNSLDLAVSGNGFFIVNNPDDTIAYTRAGEFQLDLDGYMVNSSGQRIQGFQPADRTNPETTFDSLLGDIRVAENTSPANATTQIEAMVNLQSIAEAPTVAWEGFAYADPEQTQPDPDSYNFSTSVNLYDSQGIARPATMYFVKDPAAPLNWNVYVGMSQLDPATGLSPVTDATGTGGPAVLTFDVNGNLESVDGALITDAAYQGIPINYPGADFTDNGAAQLDAFLDFTGTTQVGTSYAVSQMNQDGYTSGYLTGVNVDQSGVVTARFSNSQMLVLGQVALAQFRNPQGLQELGDNCWAETYASGDPAYGAAMTGGLGVIESSALESSNVDLSTQLVNLITAQRNFQANAKTISTADTIAQTIINLR